MALTPAGAQALLEDAYAQGRRLDVNDALAQRIRERYTLGSDLDLEGPG